MKKSLTTLGIVLLLVALTALAMLWILPQEPSYTGFVYIEQDQSIEQVIQQNISSEALCKEWAYDLADERDLSEGQWDYECGYDCVQIDDEGSSEWECAELTKGGLWPEDDGANDGENNDSDTPDDQEEVRIIELSISEGGLIVAPMSITGKAKDMFFEGSFPFSIIANDGTLLFSGIATTSEDWMTEDPVGFIIEIAEFDPRGYTEGTLKLMNDNPSGLNEDLYEYEIGVRFKFQEPIVN